MNHYITVYQPHRKNRWYVARQTIDGGYSVIAEVFNEDNANRVATALNEQNAVPVHVIEHAKRKPRAH